jgi:cell wall-associated NlpC family hydrolase
VRGTYGEWYEVDYNGTIGYMYGTYINNKDTNISAAAPQNQISTVSIVDTAMQYLGAPYRWGGESMNGFDCSGLVYKVYKDNGISVNRVAQSMYYNGTEVTLDCA